ncbi:MAG: hypothetical protein L0Y58_05700 [Verrucomicrobia subdivision 3 bacterium]|nr:hypothetical protein [Limisphaerales bacterium]
MKEEFTVTNLVSTLEALERIYDRLVSRIGAGKEQAANRAPVQRIATLVFQIEKRMPNAATPPPPAAPRTTPPAAAPQAVTTDDDVPRTLTERCLAANRVTVREPEKKQPTGLTAACIAAKKGNDA